ncbi:MAG TPA: 8-amino-7-oxononanoate synthase [Oligoflexia bacterium]|nr:8-amino-7-oxononanoate synthase [Oligoflexia bacterium]
MSSEQWIEDILLTLRADGLERTLKPNIGLMQSPGSAGVLDFSSNDYLNLSRAPDVLAAMQGVLSAGSGASRLVSGTLPCHTALEHDLALFKGYAACLLFGAGYLANIGVVPVLVNRDDAVFSDRLVHASLIDGITLSRSRHFRFQHNSPDHLEQLLQKASAARRPRMKFLCVVESIYSMDGDAAPLADICELVERFDASLLVDEAHAIGVFGRGGAGLVDELALQHRVPCCTGTLSKALGSCGGFVVCSHLVKELIVNRSRPFIYNTALPPGVVQPAHAALRKMQQDESLGAELRRRAQGFREMLQLGGLNTMGSISQIVPVMTKDSDAAVRLSAHLAAQGIVAQAIRPQTVPKGTARLRFSVTLAHSLDDLHRAAAVVIAEAAKLGIGG